MSVVQQNKNQILYKCRVCGHMRLVQEIERNDVGHEKADRIKQ